MQPHPLSEGRDAFDDNRSGRVRVRDFIDRDGFRIDGPDDRLSPEDTLIKGDFLHRELRHGLVVHVSDAMEERAFTVSSHLNEGLSCIFFLDGAVDVNFGDRGFTFRGDGRGLLEGAAVMCANPDSFRRTSRGRQHVCHLVVSAAPEWLDAEGLGEVRGGGLAARLLKDHLAEQRWTVTPRIAELVRQVVAPGDFAPELRSLYLEGRAVEIVAEALAAMLHAERAPVGGTLLTRRDTLCLQRARDLIADGLTGPLSVEAIARGAGISASGLQRLFRISEGASIFDYVRRLRLERAFEALRSGGTSVQEASVIAGYSSPANFATAFRRRFGLTPSEVSPASVPAGPSPARTPSGE